MFITGSKLFPTYHSNKLGVNGRIRRKHSYVKAGRRRSTKLGRGMSFKIVARYKIHVYFP